MQFVRVVVSFFFIFLSTFCSHGQLWASCILKIINWYFVSAQQRFRFYSSLFPSLSVSLSVLFSSVCSICITQVSSHTHTLTQTHYLLWYSVRLSVPIPTPFIFAHLQNSYTHDSMSQPICITQDGMHICVHCVCVYTVNAP